MASQWGNLNLLCLADEPVLSRRARFKSLKDATRPRVTVLVPHGEWGTEIDMVSFNALI